MTQSFDLTDAVYLMAILWGTVLLLGTGGYYGITRVCGKCRRSFRGALRREPWRRYGQAAVFGSICGLGLFVAVVMGIALIRYFVNLFSDFHYFWYG